jgi:hypothetical protein
MVLTPFAARTGAASGAPGMVPLPKGCISTGAMPDMSVTRLEPTRNARIANKAVASATNRRP